MSRIYLGPWVWGRFAGLSAFHAPFSRGVIDFGTLDEMSRSGADRPGCLLLTDAVLPSEYTLLGEGHPSEIKSDDRLESIFASELKHAAKGDTLADLIRDTLHGGDPDGVGKWKPLVPDTTGWMDVYLGGKIQSERFEWGKPGSRGSDTTPKLQAMLRSQFRVLFADAQAGRLKDSQHHRRLLDDWCLKYGLTGPDDWKQLVPQDLQRHVPGRLKRETTITESFNTADSTTLGPDLSWTEYDSGSAGNAFAIVSNRCRQSGAGNLNGYWARADSDLSSVDHYGAVDAVTIAASATNEQLGVAARFSSSAVTCYHLRWGSFGANWLILDKVSAGTITNLSTDTTYPISGLPRQLKCKANGSAISGLVDDVEELTSTDTAITTGTRCGVFGYRSASEVVEMDDFEAADLSTPAGILYTQLEKNIRGYARGTFLGGV